MRKKKVILEVITPGVYGFQLAHAKKTRIDANAQASRLAAHYSPNLALIPHGTLVAQEGDPFDDKDIAKLAAIKHYKFDSKDLNYKLIEAHEKGMSPDLNSRQKLHVGHLDKLFTTAAPEHIISHSGISPQWANEKVMTMKRGDTMFSPAFLSASLKPSQAFAFGSRHMVVGGAKEDGVHVFQIETPKGYTGGHFIGHLGSDPDEQEFLFKRGQHFRYHGMISDEPDTDDPEGIVRCYVHKITPEIEQ